MSCVQCTECVLRFFLFRNSLVLLLLLYYCAFLYELDTGKTIYLIYLYRAHNTLVVYRRIICVRALRRVTNLKFSAGLPTQETRSRRQRIRMKSTRLRGRIAFGKYRTIIIGGVFFEFRWPPRVPIQNVRFNLTSNV